MSDEKWNTDSVEDNIKFLEYYGFQDTGCFYAYDDHNATLQFNEISSRLLKNKVAGIFCFCLDGCIVHIGRNKNICKVLKNSYKNAKVPNPTYYRVNGELKKLRYDVLMRVKIYYRAENDKTDKEREEIKQQIIASYEKYFGKNLRWNGKNIISISKSIEIFKKENSMRKKDNINADLLDEFKSNRQLVEKTKRNIKVREQALRNAENRCCLECCLKKSEHCSQLYFKRRNIVVNEDDIYLEVHHLIPLFLASYASNKFKLEDLDVVENTVCLCSNCHNKLHYGRKEDVFKMLEKLYEIKRDDLNAVGLKISLEKLKELYLE